jgi:Rrf2 family protein
MSFSFTRKTDYALVGLASLSEADQAGRGPVSVRQIAERFGLPLALLMNVMKDLNRAGLVESKRGPSGGYILARPATEITIAHVIEAIEGPVALSACCDEMTGEDEDCLGCRLTERCPITGAMQRFNDLVVRFLQRMTVAEMMRDDVQFALHINPSKTSAGVSPGEDGSRNVRLVEVI